MTICSWWAQLTPAAIRPLSEGHAGGGAAGNGCKMAPHPVQQAPGGRGWPWPTLPASPGTTRSAQEQRSLFTEHSFSIQGTLAAGTWQHQGGGSTKVAATPPWAPRWNWLVAPRKGHRGPGQPCPQPTPDPCQPCPEGTCPGHGTLDGVRTWKGAVGSSTGSSPQLSRNLEKLSRSLLPL